MGLDLSELAKKINQRSLDYHLMHATAAAEKYIEDEQRNTFSSNDELNKYYSQRPVTLIYVNYDNSLDDSGVPMRVVKPRLEVIFIQQVSITAPKRTVSSVNLKISLPRLLKDKAVDRDNFSYDKRATDKLRWAMAHEIGHIILHFLPKYLKELERKPENVEFEAIQKFDSTKEEKEANEFAKHLLNFRADRNEKILENGCHKTVFQNRWQ
jgi:hypothetical protein